MHNFDLDLQRQIGKKSITLYNVGNSVESHTDTRQSVKKNGAPNYYGNLPVVIGIVP